MTGERPSGARILVGGLALLVLVVAVHGVAVPGGADNEQVTVIESEGDERLLVQPVENGSRLWPYTSRSRSVDGRTLALNLLVYGDHDRIESRFRSDRNLNWDDEPFEGGDPNGTDVLPETVRSVLWRDAHGSDRFVYVESADGGRWLPESYQLFEGAYLGNRDHIRAYESPDSGEEWVAMQAHEEYFDYFRLRHTVTSTNEAQRYAESEFLDDDGVNVSQAFLGNEGASDSDGWVTVIEFVAGVSGLGLLGSVGTVRRRLRRPLEGLFGPVGYRLRAALLMTAILGLYLGVRVVGMLLEGWLVGTSPQLVAGALYPVLAVGLPLVVYRLARPLTMGDAFFLAASAFGVAVLLDFALVGITAIPRHILLHRLLLAVALGLVAAAAPLGTREGAARLNTLLAYGLLGWLSGILLTLLDLL